MITWLATANGPPASHLRASALLARLAFEYAGVLQCLACLERLAGIHAFIGDIDALARAIGRGAGRIGGSGSNGKQENSELFKHSLPFGLHVKREYILGASKLITL
nr:hypothetical protein [uncultured Janthinobacterium sp.]